MTARTTNRRFTATLATTVSALLLTGCATGHQRTHVSSADPGQGPITIGADSSARPTPATSRAPG
ncbi:hypothetical protein ACIRVK_39575 [Streptomyces sp. NPDC101152]|uniref:hypothetical protein n=1 Tax=Streptomyces sp. NPDC101152 TaxID=3366116 RepID=UPI0037F28842